MALITPVDQQYLRKSFAAMTRPVRLLFFTRTLDCATCLQTRQILDEFPPLCDHIAIEEVNIVLEPDKAKQYGIDRTPSIAVVYHEENTPEILADSRIRFVGTPAGYEFASLVQAILLAGGRESVLTERSRARLALVDAPVTLRVFTTPTCSHCPKAVNLAYEMAFASPHITSYAIEATEFPDLARRYQITGVPKTVVNDEIEILGGLPEDEFVDQALAGFPVADPASS